MIRRVQISEPCIGEDEWRALRGPIETGWLTQGPYVAEFERAFAQRHQVSHAVATTSCTTALHLMLCAAGIGPGDEVILPSFTWLATANAVVYAGATPVLVDVEVDTYNISIEDALRHVSSRTKAVIAVHLFGRCVDVPKLRESLPQGIRVFEDAACAAGATWGQRSAGSLGHAATFSFHPRKSITTGEGGMLTTNEPDMASRAERLRNHGASLSDAQRHGGARPYDLPDFTELGFNYRMTDLQASVGLVQLGKLDEFVSQRDVGASVYEEGLSGVNVLQLPMRPLDGRHAWQSYVVRILGEDAHSKRQVIMQKLHEEEIATRAGTLAVHSLGYYRDLLGKSDQQLPGSAICRDATLAIPLHNRMSPDDYQRVIDTLRGVIKSSRF